MISSYVLLEIINLDKNVKKKKDSLEHAVHDEEKRKNSSSQCVTSSFHHYEHIDGGKPNSIHHPSRTTIVKFSLFFVSFLSISKTASISSLSTSSCHSSSTHRFFSFYSHSSTFVIDILIHFDSLSCTAMVLFILKLDSLFIEYYQSLSDGICQS